MGVCELLGNREAKMKIEYLKELYELHNLYNKHKYVDDICECGKINTETNLGFYLNRSANILTQRYIAKFQDMFEESPTAMTKFLWSQNNLTIGIYTAKYLPTQLLKKALSEIQEQNLSFGLWPEYSKIIESRLRSENENY